MNQTGYVKLTEVQREAVDLICTKLSRILSGGNSHIDNWHDIAGYATLAEQELNAKTWADAQAKRGEGFTEVMRQMLQNADAENEIPA